MVNSGKYRGLLVDIQGVVGSSPIVPTKFF